MIIVATIGAFLAAIVIGFVFVRAVHFLIMHFWLYSYLFKRSLRYIEANGRGTNEIVNSEAITWNLSGRLRAVLFIPAILLALVVTSVICLLRIEILPISVGVAITLGFLLACFGFVWVFLCVEQDGKMYCGRVKDIEWSSKSFIIDAGGRFIEFSCPDSRINNSFLVCGKKYLIGSYTYGWHMAPCDYYEWNDQKFPDDSAFT